MDPEDYPSDSDENDEDYCPTQDKSEKSGNSESESDYDSDGKKVSKADNPEASKKGKKRKKTGSKRKSKSARLETYEEPEKPGKSKEEEEKDEDYDKAKVDALWADFLSGTDDSYSNSKKENTSIPTNSTVTSASSLPEKKISKEPEKVEEPVKITKIFEFAGEKIEVTQEVKPEETKNPSTSSTKLGLPKAPFLGGSRKTGGVGSILEQLGKKNKISTLEKTKLDWDSFKKNEGLQEELQTHNRGRDGFLERKDFLERTDVRQFEIEKNLRQTKRSAR